jgi:hypothetical protein
MTTNLSVSIMTTNHKKTMAPGDQNNTFYMAHTQSTLRIYYSWTIIHKEPDPELENKMACLYILHLFTTLKFYRSNILYYLK